jgi:HAD superfamily hydrolase (TIGR01509 family)
MLKAVIFDFDGVIADTEALHFEAFNEVLAQYNIELTDEEYYEKYLGYSDIDCFNALNDDYHLEWDDAEIEDLVELKADAFEGFLSQGAPLIKGVREFIGMLERNDVPLGICSGATMRDMKAAVGRTGLLEKFKVIVTADDVIAGKPDPEGYMQVRKKLSQATGRPIVSAECIAVEDSEWGLEAARTAGMHTIGVTNTYPVPALGLADKVVDDLSTLTMEMLRAICG